MKDNTVPFIVTARDIEYFEKNLPIHSQVLKELLKTGEAVLIADTPGAVL